MVPQSNSHLDVHCNRAKWLFYLNFQQYSLHAHYTINKVIQWAATELWRVFCYNVTYKPLQDACINTYTYGSGGFKDVFKVSADAPFENMCMLHIINEWTGGMVVRSADKYRFNFKYTESISINCLQFLLWGFKIETPFLDPALHMQ